MSKFKPTVGATAAQHRPIPNRIPTNAEIRDAMRRARGMQARAIAGLFANLGK